MRYGIAKNLQPAPVGQVEDKAAAFEERREAVAKFLAEAVQACHEARLALPTPAQASQAVKHGITVEEFVASLKAAAITRTVSGGRRGGSRRRGY